jgi:hypothetical protein
MPSALKNWTQIKIFWEGTGQAHFFTGHWAPVKIFWAQKKKLNKRNLTLTLK